MEEVIKEFEELLAKIYATQILQCWDEIEKKLVTFREKTNEI